ncbi:hypothetical protein AB0945_21580 [Streptomyces sp. NPDC005474]|uniref:hypothetical protein n=1 Tax=Streptomyces sp. NPDC005474 TaxID=3154878 RepID=UPI00345372B7
MRRKCGGGLVSRSPSHPPPRGAGHRRSPRHRGQPTPHPVRSTVAFLLERWADEEAVDAVEDRPATARALARAALVSQRARPVRALQFSEHAVTRRIAGLQSGPLPNLWPVGAAVLTLGVLPALGAIDATGDFLRLLAYIVRG